jgi:hypothetical protein
MIGDVLGVQLKLLKKLFRFTVLQQLIKESVLLEDVNWGSGVAVNLAHYMRELNTILFLGLIDHLVKDAISANLQGAGFNLSALFGVRVVRESAKLTFTLRFFGNLLLLLFFLLESLSRRCKLKSFSEFFKLTIAIFHHLF